MKYTDLLPGFPFQPMDLLIGKDQPMEVIPVVGTAEYLHFECPECDGEGAVEGEVCPTCGGQREIWEPLELTIYPKDDPRGKKRGTDRSQRGGAQ